jgi:prophage maintenance system killer protein
LPRNNAVYGLTAQYIEDLHDFGIAVFYEGTEPVGEHECIDRNLLESAPLQPFQSAFGVEAYPTIYDKAACLFFSIAGGHIFTNGNKRTGILALEHFLMANAMLLGIPGNTMLRLTRATASYRERGHNPADVKGNLALMFSRHTFPFSVLRKDSPRDYRFWHRSKRRLRADQSVFDSSILQNP